MNKRLKIFPTLAKLAIIALVLGLIPILPASAGQLTVLSIDMNGTAGNEYRVNTAIVSTVIGFDPTTGVNTGDGIKINFASDFVISSVVNGDVTVTQTGGNPTKGTATVSGQELLIPITTEGTVPANALVVTVANSHITTPTVAGTYAITITTWDLGDDNAFGGAGADADTQEDTGAGAVLIGTNQVTISGTVEPTLTLAIVALATDDATTTCPLGTITPANIETCGYRSKVSTNATGGYTAYIRSGGDLLSGANTIDAVASSPIGEGTEEYGINTSDSGVDITNNSSGTTCALLDHQSATDVPAGALTTSDQSFVSSSASVANEYTTVCHAAAISGTTPAGVYLQTVTITIVGNF